MHSDQLPTKTLEELISIIGKSHKMNQICKVCGEPAAGFHFGAFTCEGCKSFFGRSYGNLNAISECKNNGECVINKKNRTACKACRLKKCLLAGMSKSGSRYGRRSNWFKIHCLLQEKQQILQEHHQQQQEQQQQQQQQQIQQQIQQQLQHLQQQQQQTSVILTPNFNSPQKTSSPSSHVHQQSMGLGLLGQPFASPLLHLPKTREELLSASPTVGSPESYNSDTSVEVGDARRLPLFPALFPTTLLPPHPGLLLPTGYHSLYSGLLQPVTSNSNLILPNNNNRLIRNQNPGFEAINKRVFLDAVLKSQRSPTPESAARVPSEASVSPVQDSPIDLSMKTNSDRGSSPANSDKSVMTERGAGSEADEESECDSDRELKKLKLSRPTPLDLTTKV